MYTAYVLSEESRNRLTEVFPPSFAEHIGHHITVQFGVPAGAEVPKQPNSVQVVGFVHDPEGLEALIISVDGSTKRPDGNTYHITWSLNREKFKPKDSNDLISRSTTHVINFIPIDVTPTVLR